MDQRNKDYYLRFASDDEKHVWSFGRVIGPGIKPGGLSDPRIFGPRNDNSCECGHLQGSAMKNRICARCGVAVGNAIELRSTRFGHVELAVPVAHPWQRDHLFTVLPVLPILLRSEKELDDMYLRILELNGAVRELDTDSAGIPAVERDQKLKALALSLSRTIADLIDGNENDYCQRECIRILLIREITSVGRNLVHLLRGAGMVLEELS